MNLPMLLDVPTPFTDSWIEAVAEANRAHAAAGRRVAQLYGAFQSSRFSSARPAKYLPNPTREQFARHVERARVRGLGFNYLINAPSYANYEYTAQGRRELTEELRFLVECGVTAVTLAVPYLIEIVAAEAPGLEVIVSTIGYVNSLRGLQQYRDAGARRVVVDVEVNRDFSFLEKAQAAGLADLEVIVNPVCIYQCNFKHAHYCTAAHGSQANGTPGHLGTPYNQYYLNWCFLQKLDRVDEFVKSPWIRPEDVPMWQELGIRHFKIAGRGSSEEQLLALVRAYLAQSYQGNLLDLLGWPHWMAFRKTADGRTLPPLEMSVDNVELDGFLAYFRDRRPDCRLGCGECNWCTEWGRRVVAANDPALRAEYAANLRANLRELVVQAPTEDDQRQAENRWAREAAKQTVRG